MNENENTITQNLWDTVKAVLRGSFIALQAYINKERRTKLTKLETKMERSKQTTLKYKGS